MGGVASAFGDNPEAMHTNLTYPRAVTLWRYLSRRCIGDNTRWTFEMTQGRLKCSPCRRSDPFVPV